MKLHIVASNKQEYISSQAVIFAGDDTSYPWAFIRPAYEGWQVSTSHVDIMFNARPNPWKGRDYIGADFKCITLRMNQIEEILTPIATALYLVGDASPVYEDDQPEECAYCHGFTPPF